MEWSVFWKSWWQKFLTQLISIKVWVLLAAFIFVALKLISIVAFTTVVSLILGVKGAYYIAGVRRNDSKDIIERT